jgi:hypothetical protein
MKRKKSEKGIKMIKERSVMQTNGKKNLKKKGK